MICIRHSVSVCLNSPSVKSRIFDRSRTMHSSFTAASNLLSPSQGQISTLPLSLTTSAARVDFQYLRGKNSFFFTTVAAHTAPCSFIAPGSLQWPRIVMTGRALISSVPVMCVVVKFNTTSWSGYSNVSEADSNVSEADGDSNVSEADSNV